jgi:hypothetical protein
MSSTFLELFRQSRRPTVKLDSYFAVYDQLFAPYAGKDITFVEVGISGGGSLEAWKKFFGPKSRIIGIDLNPALRDELTKDGFEIFIGDQASPAFWYDVYAKVGKVDILLDDGGHTNTQTWTTLTSSLPHINDGGLLVIEDTHASYMRGFGNPSRDSLVSRVMACVDELNYRSTVIDERDRRARRYDQRKLLAGVDIAGRVDSIRFYESIVALSIDSKRAVRSQKMEFGSVAALPNSVHPEDFRNRGIREKLVARVRGRLRSLARRLPL